MGDVVGDEVDLARVQSRQGLGEELGGTAGVFLAQVVPGVVQPQSLSGAGETGVVRVGDRVQVCRSQPGPLQAPSGGQFGQFPGGEGDGPLAVLASAEAFLLRCGHDAAVHDQGRGRVVEEGVDPEDTHAMPPCAYG